MQARDRMKFPNSKKTLKNANNILNDENLTAFSQNWDQGKDIH